MGCGCTAGGFHSNKCVHHLLISTVSPGKQIVGTGCCEVPRCLSTAAAAMREYGFQQESYTQTFLEMAADSEHIQAQCLHYHVALNQTLVKAGVMQETGPYMEGAKTGVFLDLHGWALFQSSCMNLVSLVSTEGVCGWLSNLWPVSVLMKVAKSILLLLRPRAPTQIMEGSSHNYSHLSPVDSVLYANKTSQSL